MKVEMHSECHYEKVSEDSQKERYMHADQLNSDPSPQQISGAEKDKRYFQPLKYNRVTHDEA